MSKYIPADNMSDQQRNGYSVPQKRASESEGPGNGSGSTSQGGSGPSRRTRPGSLSIDESKGDGGNKKKRISLSCAQCAKRKQKCNREFPCQHCLARKVPELCVPYIPQSRRDSSAEGPDSHTAARLDRIEDVLSVILRHHGGLWTYKDVKQYMSGGPYTRVFPSAPSSPSSPHRRSLALAAEHSLSPARPSALASTPLTYDDHTHEYEDGGSADDDDLGKGVTKGWLGELDGGVPESLDVKDRIKMKLDVHGTPAENLQRLITDCGVSPHKIAELVQELPPKPYADRIVDSFFSGFNHVRYPIDEHLFRLSYEDLYDTSKTLDPSNVRALPLVFIVLALGVRLATEDWAGDEQTRKLSSLRMYWSSRRSILIATAVQSESIELVVTRLLSAMYLVMVHDRRLTECWSQLGASLRTAQAIGLHRDGTKLGLDPFETEYRRRLWSYLYHADKLYSLILGRPPSISDSYTDTQDPTNIELSEFHRLSPMQAVPRPLPLNQPTSATFLILRKSLSRIVGRVVHHFQKLDEPAKYADVQVLNDEINNYVENLPPCFQMYQPDKSMDKDNFWLPVHRMLLLAEVLVTIIILHRPWLLRKLSTNQYAASRTQCFEAAKMDFQLRQEFQQEVPDHRSIYLTGQFKMFNSAMIAGISAIIDPRGPDGDQMRKILTTFLEQNPWHEAVKKDETTRKEVQIILTLSRRAAQIYENSFNPNAADTKSPDKDSAALLLALGGSVDASDSNTFNATTRRRHDTDSKVSSMVNTPSIPAYHPRPPPVNTGTGNLSWSAFAGPQQSPATSTGGHEDDHSQRLFDYWINNNSTLAFGSLNDAVPMIDDSSMGNALGPSALPPMMAAQPTYGQMTPTARNPVMTPGAFDGTPIAQQPSQPYWGGGGLTGMSSTGGPMSSYPPTGATPGPLPGSVGNDSTLRYEAGGQSTSTPMYPNMPGQPVPQAGPGATLGENSDEYWNALIDGILSTTSGGQGIGGQ